MGGIVTGLYRHPIKGFTPERLEQVSLSAGAYFPCDRLFAVESGPSGFDPVAPAHISKTRFTVLAKMAEVARARTAYDEASGLLTVDAEGMEPLSADLSTDGGAAALCDWLTRFLGDQVTGPLRLLKGPQTHRFMDDPTGYVSVINLASVRDLEARLGVAIDPLRFRANLYIEGWSAWAEMDQVGQTVRMGEAEAEITKPIVRCAATHVDPVSGERDLDLVSALFEAYGHRYCGVYLRVLMGGDVAVGDPALLSHVLPTALLNP
ncbi:MAG: hypothetical protein RJA87_1844 [Pseudomonadota bacterium]|jgi:uncharacterized protein YcbX